MGPRHDRHFDAVLEEQRVLQRLAVERGTGRCRPGSGTAAIAPIISSGAGARRRARGRGGRARASASSRLRRMTSGHPPGTQRRHEAHRVGHAEPRASDRTCPVQSNSRRKRLRSARVAFAPWLIDDGRIRGWRFAAHVEERGAFRRADPLVAVARVVRGAQRVEIERQHAGRVRAVDQRVDAARGSAATMPRDREDERRSGW